MEDLEIKSRENLIRIADLRWEIFEAIAATLVVIQMKNIITLEHLEYFMMLRTSSWQVHVLIMLPGGPIFREICSFN